MPRHYCLRDRLELQELLDGTPTGRLSHVRSEVTLYEGLSIKYSGNPSTTPYLREEDRTGTVASWSREFDERPAPTAPLAGAHVRGELLDLATQRSYQRFVFSKEDPR
jgi:hypothetical protein